MPIDATNPIPPNIPRLAGIGNVPDHVPADLVRTLGIVYGPEFLKNPHEYMKSLQHTQPRIVFDTGPLSNQWTLFKHEDAQFMLRTPEIFSNEGATPFPRDPNDYFYFIPIEIDPPHHRKYRKILEQNFSVPGVKELEDQIRLRANGLIDQILNEGKCEFTTAFGRPLPVSIFLDIMGLPQDQLDTFVEWAMQLLHSNTAEGMGQAMSKISAYLKEMIEEKRANPDDAIISKIVHAKVDGIPLHEKEIFGFVVFLFIGGLDTVFATLNNIWAYLAQHPDKVAEMIADPENIDNQVEELLRVWAVTFSGRVLAKDFEWHGIQMKKGDRITAILPTCNFDPDVWDNPTEVDFKRPRRPILSFAGGVHSCMGAHLARLETKIGLQEWLKRIPTFKMKDGTTLEYRPGGVVGPEHLPLEW